MIATYGCKPTPPGSTNLASVQLTLTGFIGDCKVDNGSTNIDVGYSVSVETRQGPNSFDNAIRLDTYKGNSPTTANKDSYTTTIKVPKDQPYWIDIIIDAKDCSLCAKGGCNPYNWNGYQMNNIPPYWIYRTYNTSVPPTGSIIITPLWAIRNPNGSRNCFCQIKL
jgi:hypothetical protein